MARRYIGLTKRGIATLRNVRKAETGEPLVTLDENEVDDLVIDFTGYLESGETVSSATATPNGVTETISTTSPKVTLTLSEANQYNLSGRIEVVVTMSSGTVWRQYIRVRRRARAFASEYDNLTDYT
jgi:pyocin large subunit-like protein